MTDQWKSLAALYRRFAGDDPSLDFSTEAAERCYQHETFGTGDNPYGVFAQGRMNGYAIGKQWLNLQITSWQRDIRAGLLSKWELRSDPTLPHPWIDNLIRKWPSGHHASFISAYGSAYRDAR